MTKINKQKVKGLLTGGVEEVVIKEHLEERLLNGERLRVKFGIDPTADILHLGHSVPLWKLRQLQDLGHQIIFLIGDFTAKIGDPTGRTNSRTSLSSQAIKRNMRNYTAQVGLILNLDKVEIRYNSEWWDKMEPREIMLLASKVTYGQISARADFKKRLKEDKDFTLEEFIYPVLQGYDSVELKADVEIGGTDQKFNMLMGRRIQKRYGQRPQDVITCPLLEGLDGKEKMSKSLNNYVTLTEKPNKMYGKIMSIPDDLTKKYFELTTKLSKESIKEILKEKPHLAKARLAKEIVKLYHGEKKGLLAEKEFNRIFREKKLPAKIPEIQIRKKKIALLDLLLKTKLALSKSEAKRLVLQKGVKIDSQIQEDWQKVIEIKKGQIVQVGKRKFVKIDI